MQIVELKKERKISPQFSTPKKAENPDTIEMNIPAEPPLASGPLLFKTKTAWKKLTEMITLD